MKTIRNGSYFLQTDQDRIGWSDSVPTVLDDREAAKWKKRLTDLGFKVEAVDANEGWDAR